MKDIIDEAIENQHKEKERTAVGSVKGEELTLSKEKYYTRMQEKMWRVCVSLDSTERIRDGDETGLEAEEADTFFEKLVGDYDLEEE